MSRSKKSLPGKSPAGFVANNQSHVIVATSELWHGPDTRVNKRDKQDPGPKCRFHVIIEEIVPCEYNPVFVKRTSREAKP